MFKLVSLMADGFKRLDLEEKLVFPDGRLLVHGRNESGKSTLMEAIHYALYGTPLRPSKNAGNEDIICYGKDRAVVELEFSIDDSQYQVRRELYRKKTNEHILNKRDKDGQLSRVTRGARNVNSALEEILHGIDSDALLNSCLVEQKELGKLEDAKKEERVRAMSSLLNLEAFVDSRNQLKKDSSEIEKTQQQTLTKLEEARSAKEVYDDAQIKLELAQKRLTDIGEEKKKVEENLEKAENTLKSVEKLSELLDQLRDAESSLKNIDARQKDAQKQYDEATEAKTRILELDEEIENYSPAKEAAEKIDEISTLFTKLTNLHNETARLESELESTRKRLSESKESEDRIKELEGQEAGAKARKESASTKRTGGLAGLAVGLLIIAYCVMSSIWIGAALGAAILAIGAYLYALNNPSKLDDEINQARSQRDQLLGDKARIKDYNETVERLETEIKEVNETQSKTEESLIQQLNQLPNEPREYKSTLNLTDTSTLNKLRKEIQEDNESLTRYQAQKGTLQKKADSLKEYESTLEKYQKQREEQTSEIEKLGTQINEAEQESGITREQVDKVTRELRTERDTYLKRSASLEKDEQERNSDIVESNQIIEEKEELKEQYPVLLEETEKQRFQLEAMRRAGKLLDITRENIMAGVKQNVEKNMMQFLPTLTDNRYNMARIDEANYRIEVYDREAKTWRGKGVFSGATQDQFSLALRLAFAISTIPSSRGARPGFIFLDEPLSGFDAQRRSGFMQLLREDLSKHFDQIIVISHIETLAEEFPQSLTLDSGKIVQR